MVTNVYSQDKRISEKFSKVSGLSLSDMGEYNDAEKERILAILEESLLFLKNPYYSIGILTIP